MAESMLRKEPKLQDREPASLAHEAMRKVDGVDKASWVNRREFYGYVRRAMWSTIIDWVRSKQRRPDLVALGSWVAQLNVADADELVAIEDALVRLGREDARAEQVVRGRFIEGLSEVEVAERLGVPLGTAKSWIRRGLAEMAQLLESTAL